MTITQSGLSQAQVTQKLAELGQNVLPEQPLPSNFAIFLFQLKNPLIIVLIGAGITTFLLGHFSDSLIIFLSVLINSALGFVQEQKASQAFLALKKFVTNTAEVVREGKRRKIQVSQIVPDDIVLLFQGSKIPADGKLIFANRAYFDEAIITGESMPTLKVEHDSIFMGTTLTAGEAQMIVTATGKRTQIGQIAQEIQSLDQDTPLKKQLILLSKRLVLLILILTIVIFGIGLLRGNPLVEMFSTSVALAVSSIPEGLVISLTAVLAIGMQKILQRKGLVKKMEAAETLGGVTTICIDKTGTLTEGKMQVVDHLGSELELAKQILVANDLDDPIVIAAANWAQKIIPDNTDYQQPRLDSIPFSPNDKFFISLHQQNSKQNIIYVNGAPEVLLAGTDLSTKEKKLITENIENFTRQGRRVLGLAKKIVPLSKKNLTTSDAKNGLEWVGLLAFYDPVRPSVKEALTQAQRAGIKIMIITGDYAQTTQFALAEVGMPVSQKQILLGTELAKLTIDELAQKLKDITLFARTTPDQKHLIVQALQKSGQVVAMMGDGVNDAPAIHQADIGIVVDGASDVAKESADLVLLDSDFSTIIASIEEGRAIFDNIRKVILYLLSDAFTEILVVTGGILLGLPLPLTAVQIIWINLVSDGLPGLALTIDPHRHSIMHEHPRSPREKLINNWMMLLIVVVGLLAGLMALGVFVMSYKITGNVLFARSLTFATLGLDSLAYVFSIRSLLVPFWKRSLFENHWLIVAVLAGLSLQVFPFLLKSSRDFFGVAQLSLFDWLVALSTSVVIFLSIEVFKLLYRLSARRK